MTDQADQIGGEAPETVTLDIHDSTLGQKAEVDDAEGRA